MYSNYAVGFNNVVVPDANEHGIAVGNTPGTCSASPALAVLINIGTSQLDFCLQLFSPHLPGCQVHDILHHMPHNT